MLATASRCFYKAVRRLLQIKRITSVQVQFDKNQRRVWLEVAARARGGAQGFTALTLHLDIPVRECKRRVRERRDHPTLTGPKAASVIDTYDAVINLSYQACVPSTKCAVCSKLLQAHTWTQAPCKCYHVLSPLLLYVRIKGDFVSPKATEGFAVHYRARSQSDIDAILGLMRNPNALMATAPAHLVEPVPKGQPSLPPTVGHILQRPLSNIPAASSSAPQSQLQSQPARQFGAAAVSPAIQAEPRLLVMAGIPGSGCSQAVFQHIMAVSATIASTCPFVEAPYTILTAMCIHTESVELLAILVDVLGCSWVARAL